MSITEIERIADALLPLCPECGPVSPADEDGCCAQCGATCIIGGGPALKSIAELIRAAVLQERDAAFTALRAIAEICTREALSESVEDRERQWASDLCEIVEIAEEATRE